MRNKYKAGLQVANGFHSEEPKSPQSSDSSGFLTKAQQDILDAAVSEKQKLGTLKTAKSHSEEKALIRQSSQGPTPTYKDRTSRSKSDKLGGKPKKHGAGGKYNWGSTLDSEAISGAQDPHDPNYDSGAEDTNGTYLAESPFIQAQDSKQAITTILKEYFLTGNQEEAIASLQGLVQKGNEAYVAKKLVTLALDHRDHERELASELLLSLQGTVLSESEIVEAFRILLKSVEDLKLDVPQAPEFLAFFTARAIVDGTLPISFIQTITEDENANQVLVKANHLLKASHSSERLQNCWGCADSSSYQQLVDQIQKLLNEYLSSHDAKEAQLCLSKINAPLAMHELVKQGLTKAMASNSSNQILTLLDKLASEGNISEDQLFKGFKRIQANLNDLKLDIPDVDPKFKALCDHALRKNWFPKEALSENIPKEIDGNAKKWSFGLRAFKKEICGAVLEYFSSQDIVEVKNRLKELDQPGFHSLAVKQIVQLAMERKARERELAAKLLNELSNGFFSTDELILGFKRLLASAEDLILDIPEAPQHLSTFLGRLVVDELLPPASLTQILSSLTNGSLGVDIIKAVGNTLKQRHAYERLQTCWQPNSDLSQVRNKIKGLVTEYLETGDFLEASRCWRDLGVPFFGHQLVFQILSASFGRPEAHEPLFALLGKLLETGELSETQLEMGFDRVQQQISDLQLDYPSASSQFSRCKIEAENMNWLHTQIPNGNL